MTNPPVLIQEPALGGMEAKALAWLRQETGPDEGGWGTWDGAHPPGMDHRQFRSALSRLRKKGLASCHRWHDGQGNAYAEWLWFPERTTAYNPPYPEEGSL